MVVYHDRNLIINYIPRNLSDQDLSALFSTAGTIRTCRIIRDHNDGSSFGFGFCEYEDAESAHRAIERFNGFRLADKVLKVSLAKLQGRLYQSSNLYVKNFPFSVTDDEIAAKFSNFGKVIQCRILRDRDTNASKGSAYVLFDNRIDAENAKKALDGVQWPGFDGQPMTIKFATPPYRQPSTSGQSKSSQSKVYRSSNGTEREENSCYQPTTASNTAGLGCDLNPYFSESSFVPPGPHFQPQISHIYNMQPSPNPPVVTWVTDCVAENFSGSPLQLAPAYLPPYLFTQNPSFPGFWPALQPSLNAQTYGLLYGPQLDGLTNTVHGCPVFTGLQNPLTNNTAQTSAALRGLLSGLLIEENGGRKQKNHKTDKGNMTSVYVYNIGNLMTERRLSELFSRFGDVVNVSIPRDPKTNYTRNFGFVTFSAVQSAQLAINSMNGFLYDGRRLQVSLRRPKNSVAKPSVELQPKYLSEISPTEVKNPVDQQEMPEQDIHKNGEIITQDACISGLSSLQLSDSIPSQNHMTSLCSSGIAT